MDNIKRLFFSLCMMFVVSFSAMDSQNIAAGVMIALLK